MSPPAAYVAIEAILLDGSGQTWSSRGVYTADMNGAVDTIRDASIGGTYRGVDAEGLFWSMLPMTLEEMGDISATVPEPQCIRRTPDFDEFNASYESRKAPVIIDLTARVIGDLADADIEAASARHTVHFMAKDITRTEVRENGLIGTLFEPEGKGPHPAVLMITGSDGGCYEARAALMASHGVAAFALAHFNYPGRPDNLHNIDLEYFRDAMSWLAARQGVERVGLQGPSLGGAGALLIASIFPDHVSAVVADVPGNLVQGGFDFATMKSLPGWLLNGEPLPYVAFENYAGRESELHPGTLEMQQNFRDVMMKTDFDDPRWIKVENIKAPIMLTSGTADAMWPTSPALFSDLSTMRFGYPVTWLNYQGAGHTIGIPMLVKARADRTERNEALNITIAIGGNPSENAHAQADCFPRMVEFLKDNAEPRRSKFLRRIRP